MKRTRQSPQPAPAAGKTIPDTQAPTSPAPPRSLLASLGVIGLEPVEPALIGALIGAEPLLLIGPHGTGKSYLLNRISAALGLTWRHYNASLLNYDDLVGFPLPGRDGTLEYVRTPASIWDVEAVFVDEISRCRPDLQNKLFPIIHERRVQGILLEKLVYRWAAMNPPAGEDELESAYHGSEPLDAALADRFAFVIELPGWDQLSEEQQEQVILSGGDGFPSHAGERLRSTIERGRDLLTMLREEYGSRLASYVRSVTALLSHGGTTLSPRRAGMVLRNLLAVHAARLAVDPAADAADSAYGALRHSLPQPATGQKIQAVKLLAAHREAWKLAGMAASDPRRIVLLEKDPLIRALRATQIESLRPPEFSTIVADALATLTPGARHALAAAVFELGAAGRLVAAVAEQCAVLYALAATPQDLQESVGGGSPRHSLWKTVVARVVGLDPKHPDTPLATNLFVGLFAAGEIQSETDLDLAWQSWREARKKIRGFHV